MHRRNYDQNPSQRKGNNPPPKKPLNKNEKKLTQKQRQQLEKEQQEQKEQQKQEGKCAKINFWFTKKWIDLKNSHTYKNMQLKWKKIQQFLGMIPEDYRIVEGLVNIPFKPVQMQLGECTYTLDMNKIKEKDFKQLQWDYQYSNTNQEDEYSSDDDEDDNLQVQDYKEKIKEFKEKFKQEKLGIEKNNAAIEQKEKEKEDTEIRTQFLLQKLAIVQEKIQKMQDARDQIDQ